MICYAALLAWTKILLVILRSLLLQIHIFYNSPHFLHYPLLKNKAVYCDLPPPALAPLVFYQSLGLCTKGQRLIIIDTNKVVSSNCGAYQTSDPLQKHIC